MGISFHVYQNVDEYVKRNNERINPKAEVNEASLPLADLYITPDEKLMLVLDCLRLFEHPDVSRSIACFQLNNIKKHLKGDEKLVLHDKISFNPKNQTVDFVARKLRKPLMTIRVGRYWGDLPLKTKRVDTNNKFFNIASNKVDLILAK